MLLALSIRDIVLIDKLDLSFGVGLSIFTGETGAGKSIILDSLSLALGARGDGGLVRGGSASASVTASFEVASHHPTNDWLREHDLSDGDSLILRRVQFADGRTKAFINDRPVSTTLLRQFGRTLVEIHGQHDDRALLDPSSHRQLLDQFGGLLPDVRAVSALWDEWRELREKAESLARQLETAQREADYLQASCDELDSLAPQDGEEEALAAKRQTILSSAKLRADLETASDALSGQFFPSTKLSGVLRRLERQPGLPENLKSIIAGIERVLIEADEARTLVEAELRAGGDGNVEAIEERLFKLRAVARKHRLPVSELPNLHQRFKTELANLATGADQLHAAKKAAKAAEQAYAAAADALGEKRLAAGVKLDRAVQKELKPLRLEKAQFHHTY